MKVVILAGGKGTRLGDTTKKIPKPMVKLLSKLEMDQEDYLINQYFLFVANPQFYMSLTD